jgi:hypothetical protein
MSTRPRQPNTFLSDSEFEIVRATDDWKTSETCRELWKLLPQWMGNDETVGLYTSGSLNSPRLEGGHNVVAGIDRARHETKPMKDEPEINMYHWFVAAKTTNPKTGNLEYPVYGPFIGGTRAPHWTTLDELSAAYKLDGSSPDDPLNQSAFSSAVGSDPCSSGE